MLKNNKKTIDFKVGDTLQVECTGLGHNGEGVCRYDGLALFVPLVLPGEKAEIEVVEMKKRHGIGRLIRIIDPASSRVEPPCPYYGICGGCQLQHLSYSDQLFWKKRTVEDAFSRIGHLSDIKINDVIGMDEPWYYRNKMQLPVGKEKQEIVIGCYQQGTHQVVNTPKCLIQSEWNNQALAKVLELVKELKVPVYSEATHTGWLRHVMGRSNRRGEGILVLVGTTAELPQGKEKWVEALKEIPGLRGIILNVNEGRTNTVVGRENHLIWGDASIQETLGDFEFSLSGTAFFQVNPVQTEILYNKVVEAANLTGNETILDAYCGTGTIALYLASKAKKVIGIERHVGAVEDAKENARANKISNCEFWTGDVESYLEQINQLGLDVIVVDPPRTGCSPKLLETLSQTPAKKMVYVSCNPSTLARDAGLLAQEGWTVKNVQPVDMFPQTSHIECVALIERD